MNGLVSVSWHPDTASSLLGGGVISVHRLQSTNRSYGNSPLTLHSGGGGARNCAGMLRAEALSSSH